MTGAAAGHQTSTPGWEVVREYKGNGLRSRTFLVRSPDGERAIWKEFGAEYERYFQRELTALTSLREVDVHGVLPPLLEIGERYFVVPYFEHARRKRTFWYRMGYRLYPLWALRRIFASLEAFYEAGFELLDMGPKNALFDKQGRVMLIDFEFAFEGAARADVPFERSQTVRGPAPTWEDDVPHGEAAARDGGFYRRKWTLVTGLPVRSILRDSPFVQWLKRSAYWPAYYVGFLLQSIPAASRRRARRKAARAASASTEQDS